jgi:hypothetical protein
VSENCWILVTANGIAIDNGDHVEHFTTQAKAAQRIADHQATDELTPGYYANATPRQLDQPCLIIRCGCCKEEFDESGEGYTVHFAPGETSLVTEADWTVRPDGTYRCTACSPDGSCDDCWNERKAVATP